MRKLVGIAIVAAVLFADTSTGAGHPRPGVRLLLGSASIGGSDSDAFKDPVASFGIGAVMLQPLAPGLALETGLSFVQKGGQGTVTILGNDVDSTLTLNYLEIPVFLRFAPGSGMGYISGGLTFDATASAEVKSTMLGTSDTEDIKDDLTTLDVCLAIGGGATFSTPGGTASVGLQYARGLATIDKDGDGDLLTQTISLVANFEF